MQRPRPSSYAHSHRQPCGLNSSIDFTFIELKLPPHHSPCRTRILSASSSSEEWDDLLELLRAWTAESWRQCSVVQSGEVIQTSSASASNRIIAVKKHSRAIDVADIGAYNTLRRREKHALEASKDRCRATSRRYGRRTAADILYPAGDVGNRARWLRRVYFAHDAYQIISWCNAAGEPSILTRTMNRLRGRLRRGSEVCGADSDFGPLLVRSSANVRCVVQKVGHG